MKKPIKLSLRVFALASTVIICACSSPIGLTSWKNPNSTGKVSKVVVLALLDKLTYIQPMEEAFTNYFNSQGLKSIQSLTFMVPFQQYEMADVKKKLDSLGADGLLIISYKGSDVSVDYNQPTYYGYYGRFGAFGGGVVAAGGGWSTSTTFNLRANLYITKDDGLLWTGDITVTDPGDTGGAMTQMAQSVYADWVKNSVLKYPPQPK